MRRRPSRTTPSAGKALADSMRRDEAEQAAAARAVVQKRRALAQKAEAEAKGLDTSARWTQQMGEAKRPRRVEMNARARRLINYMPYTWLGLVVILFFSLLAADFYHDARRQEYKRAQAAYLKRAQETERRKRSRRTGSEGYDVATDAVRRVAWSPAALRRAVLAREPVVLTGTPADAWPARRRWTPAYLQARMEGGIDDVLPGRFNWNWDPQRRLCARGGDASAPQSAVAARIPACRGAAKHQRPLFNISAGAFFGAMRRGQSRLYMAPIGDEIARSGLEQDLGAWRTLMHGQGHERAVESPEVTARLREDPSETSCFVWIGGHVVSHTHYDRSHNLYVHFHGAKRFLLSPPQTWRRLYLFPRGHPGNQKSQVDWEDPDPARFPRWFPPALADDGDGKCATPGACEAAPDARRKATAGETQGQRPLLDVDGQNNVKGGVPALEARIGPGDVLYIPPFWFHHVTALDVEDKDGNDDVGATKTARGTEAAAAAAEEQTGRRPGDGGVSISANVWSLSSEIVSYETAMAQPLPDIFQAQAQAEAEGQAPTQDGDSSEVSAHQATLALPPIVNVVMGGGKKANGRAKQMKRKEAKTREGDEDEDEVWVCDTVVALAAFLEHLVERMAPYMEPGFSSQDRDRDGDGAEGVAREFVKQVLLESRYGPLASTLACPASSPASLCSSVRTRCLGATAQARRQTRARVIEQYDIASYASRIAAALQPGCKMLPDEAAARATCTLRMGNYVEELVGFVVGPHRACAFLSCLF